MTEIITKPLAYELPLITGETLRPYLVEWTKEDGSSSRSVGFHASVKSADRWAETHAKVLYDGPVRHRVRILAVAEWERFARSNFTPDFDFPGVM